MAKKKRLKIALIGYGAISQTLFDVFAAKKPAIDIVGVLVRPGRAKATQKQVGRKVAVVDSLKALLKLKPDVVVEAASQQAVRDWGETILKKGIDLMVIATGAYGDPKLWKRHLAVAAKSGARLRLPSGAIAGLDRFRSPVDQGADGHLPRHAGRCRPALSEERQCRGHRGAVRRGPRQDGDRAGGRSDAAGGHQCQPPRGRGRVGRAQDGTPGAVNAGQSQDRRADRAHHGGRPDENGAPERLVSGERGVKGSMSSWPKR